MNKVILMGRLVRDPDVRYSQGSDSLAIARFTLAVDRPKSKEGEQNADFIGCVSFGRVAEFAEKYLFKGTKILIEGRWQTGSYKNKDDKTVYTNECAADRIEFAESKRAQGDGQSSKPETDKDGFMNIADSVDSEGLPFN